MTWSEGDRWSRMKPDGDYGKQHQPKMAGRGLSDEGFSTASLVVKMISAT
jgi:hypothetical protein